MKANELRLGNYVCRLNRQNILKVCSIDSSGSIYFDGLDGHHFDLNEGQRIEPIPITPEILEKCGFVKIKDGLFAPDIYRKTYTNIAIEYSFDVYIDSDCLFYSGMSIVHLYFLHQLQNLYWCLCGAELEISLQ